MPLQLGPVTPRFGSVPSISGTTATPCRFVIRGLRFGTPSVCGRARARARTRAFLGAFRETCRANVQICPTKRDGNAIWHPERPEIQS